MELHELMACGKELGLKGSALKEWVDQERENTRAARAQEQERSVQSGAPKPRAEDQAARITETRRRSLLPLVPPKWDRDNAMEESSALAAHLRREERRPRCLPDAL
ncbi:hypothetical protein HPB47_003472 [Ixodes persulcatus]|uniref:Uncharacterized protein n=1 Tax=Ixodes persulcatus TaxID=34615 RepID=A0AC60PIF2_IXOPE|nr:hypothetical protein HPB47_003472 [Ixodes persulcatus]